MADQEKAWMCPNCGPGTKTHTTAKGHVCETCGGTFTFVAGEAKLQEIGELDKVKADVEELKQRLPASVPAAIPTAEEINDGQPPEPDDVEEEDDDEDL